MHPFVLIYSITALFASGVFYSASDQIMSFDFFLGFALFIPTGIFVLLNFRENSYPIYLFFRGFDTIRWKKRAPVFDKYFAGALIFAVFADFLGRTVVIDSWEFYAGAMLNMLWPVLDLFTKDAGERHPVIWRKKGKLITPFI